MQGAAQGAATQALLQQKQQMEQLREQRLSELRMKEHATNTQTDIAARQAALDAENAKRATFYKGTQVQPTTTTVGGTDAAESGGTLTEGTTTTTQPSRIQQTTSRLEAAKQSGDPTLIAQAYTEQKDTRAEQAQKLKDDVERRKTDYYNKKLDIDQQKTDLQQQKLDALLGAGTKAPAKIAEINSLTDMFGGDRDKAIAVAYGVKDKPRSDAVLSLSKSILASDLTGGMTPEVAIVRAEQIVDVLRKRDVPSKGGAEIGSRDYGGELGAEIMKSGDSNRPTPPPVVRSGNITATFTGRYSSSGRPIYRDAAGNQFLGQ